MSNPIPKLTAPLTHFQELQKKAKLSIAVAMLMLKKRADDPAVEDQSVALMYLPDRELRETYERLARAHRAVK